MIKIEKKLTQVSFLMSSEILFKIELFLTDLTLPDFSKLGETRVILICEL